MTTTQTQPFHFDTFEDAEEICESMGFTPAPRVAYDRPSYFGTIGEVRSVEQADGVPAFVGLVTP